MYGQGRFCEFNLINVILFMSRLSNRLWEFNGISKVFKISCQSKKIIKLFFALCASLFFIRAYDTNLLAEIRKIRWSNTKRERETKETMFYACVNNLIQMWEFV